MRPPNTISGRTGVPRRRSPGRAATSMLVIGALSASGLVAVLAANTASAAVPTFPDNLLVFPNRDFVTVEGYAEHRGETATLEINRPGVGLVGSAQGVISGGDVAFEVNHPGGVCWGNGTGVNVTPDILPGDNVSLRLGGQVVGDTTVQDAFVTEKSSLSGSTLTVKGHIGAGVDPANTEQRIVEPALTATAVGKRDIRAIPGPLTPAPRGAYSSSLEFAGENFTATYVFDDPAVAQIAADAGLGERLLSWQFVDPAGNRQGVTIAERGEPGGPGFGGCPNGPLQSGPPAPNAISAATVSGGVKLTWTPAAAIPGTQPITGYRVTAVAQSVSANGEQVEIGRRIGNPAATGTTITGLSSGETYVFEVVSTSSVGQTFPAVSVSPITDSTPPTVSASLSGGSYPVAQKVSLSANESGSEIYYTTDGTDPVDGAGDVGVTAQLYSGAITITATTTLRYAAFDPSGNVSTVGEQVYTITNKPLPATPTLTDASAGTGSVTLSWSDDDASVTAYEVQVYDAAGATKLGIRTPSPATAKTITITDLTPDVSYRFSVVARNANGDSPESAKSGPLTPLGAVVANAGPDQDVTRRTTATTVSLTGAGSTTAGATYAWTQLATATGAPIAATDPDAVSIVGGATLSPSFSLPLYRYPMTNNPLTFRLAVTVGGTSRTDTVLVTPKADQVFIGTAKWKVGDLRVTGTGTVVGGTVTVHRGSLAGPVLGLAPMTAAAPPATGGVFDLRVRNAAAGATSPGTVWVESSLGGTAGPFTVG